MMRNLFHRIISLLRVVVAVIEEDQPTYFHMGFRAKCLDGINFIKFTRISEIDHYLKKQ